MNLRLLFGAFAIWAFLLAPAAKAQNEDDRGGALGTAEDVDPDESPVIIEQRPPPGDEDGKKIRSSQEAFVQIRGAWASDQAACASGDQNDENGIYLTNTLIRWEDGTFTEWRGRDLRAMRRGGRTQAALISDRAARRLYLSPAPSIARRAGRIRADAMP